MELKVNIGSQDGKSTQLTVPNAESLHGLKIGQTFKGELIDKSGYEFMITGGSNVSGLPMRSDVEGAIQRKILIAGGVGYNPKRDGTRRRRTVAGNTIGPKTSQINVKIVKQGPNPLIEQAADEQTDEE